MPPNDPLILAFDTSAAQCAVALVCGTETLGQAVEDMTKGQAERLIPMVEEVLNAAGKSWKDLELIGVGVGPGNFTGVRISVAAARGLALSLSIPAIGVSVFEALAYGTKGNKRVSLDGRRDMVFWQDFRDGAAVNEPHLSSAEDARSDSVIGFLAGALTNADPAIIAKVALQRFGRPQPRPAPLYLRSADAALPADPPPEIFP